MNDTLYKIQKLEHERHELYKLASHRQLTSSQRDRLMNMAGQLQVLWDQHRREDAAVRWGGARSMGKRNSSAA